MAGYSSLPAAVSDSDEFITQQQAARIIQVNVRTIRAMIEREELPAYRLGNRVVRIRRSDLDRVLTPMGRSTTEHIQDAVRKVIAAAPTMSDEQRSRITSLLQAGGGAR